MWTVLATQQEKYVEVHMIWGLAVCLYVEGCIMVKRL